MNFSKRLIPLPKNVRFCDKEVSLSKIVTKCEEYADLVNSCLQYSEKLGSFSGNDAEVALRKNDDLETEAYTIDINAETAVISASDRRGAMNGMITLLQLLDKGKLPECHIEDYPDCCFRSVMIDLARNPHSLDYIKSFIDLCAFYKIPFLQLHFTDDQSYTLPSRIYPKLSTKGRHYTFEEIAEIEQYAYSHGVEIMPEIDVPGHSTAFCEAYPEIFGTDNIIPATEEALSAVESLFDELCDMFPRSTRIHIGGDEAKLERWSNNEKCRDYVLSRGIDFDMKDKHYLAERILVDFICRMAKVVERRGRTAMVWEGFDFSVNDLVPRSIEVMAWESYYQLPGEFLDAGFTVINSSFIPMYIVTPTRWSRKEVFNWDIYKWQALNEKSPYYLKEKVIEPHKNVVGGQLLAWGEVIVREYSDIAEGVKDERDFVAERAPYMAENTWNIKKLRTFENAEEAFALCDGKIKRIWNN